MKTAHPSGRAILAQLSSPGSRFLAEPLRPFEILQKEIAVQPLNLTPPTASTVTSGRPGSASGGRFNDPAVQPERQMNGTFQCDTFHDVARFTKRYGCYL